MPASSQARQRAKKRKIPDWVRWFMPFEGIRSDLAGRARFYSDDWRQGLNCGVRILAPATYVFFNSAIPALAFGQQMSAETGGILTVVHILTATAITGVIQAVVGGQPLLIVGVSEPITLIYGYAYTYGKDRPGLGQANYLGWMAWTCVWAGLMLILLGVFNACRYTNRFTRLSGELFGMLIAVLFMQQAIKGLRGEFKPDETPLSTASEAAQEFQWRLSNGLWATVLGFGTVLSALKIQQARSWRFMGQGLRGFLADYGVTICVVFWSCLSYALQGAPEGIPRRLALPNTWEVKTTWTVAARMADVPAAYIVGAFIPAVIIVVLFYFDHTVSAQMAQLEEFNLTKPPAYHYDLFLLGWMTILCGLLGLPPVNGVLPQAPLHTKSLITLKQQNILATVQRAAKAGRGSQGEMLDRIVQSCHERGMTQAATAISNSLGELRGTDDGSGLEADKAAVIEAKVAKLLPTAVQDQRITNTLQSLLVGACLGITPGIKKMPTSVLWGYFAYLSIASLPDSQFWERFLLIFVDPLRRPPTYPGQAEAPWLGRVRWRTMVLFTAFQAFFCGAVYAITWIPIAGVVFPVPILLLIPLREHLLPRIFGRKNVAVLDPGPFEDEDGNPLGWSSSPPDPEAPGQEESTTGIDAPAQIELGASGPVAAGRSGDGRLDI